MLKGPSRPVNCAEDRKKVLESLQEVDEVIIFDDVDASQIRDQTSPDVLVKGGEWTADEVRERDNVPDEIGIKIYPLVQGYSTTEVLKKIRSKETWEKNA